MTNQQHDNIFNEFFQVFSKPIVKTLSKKLDASICKNINFKFDSFSTASNVDGQKKDEALFKIEYAVEDKQGSLAILLPEELLAIASDILTGGEGKSLYKGSLSEIETNSVNPILNALFKDLENAFKHAYGHDLIFSANSYLILKEMPDYKINSGDSNFDFVVGTTLTLNENEEYKISIFLEKSVVEQLMADLGFSTDAARKIEKNNIDLSCLADIKLNITAELGRTQVPIKYALELVGGSIVELDTQNNADIKVFANGIEFAYAQVVAIDDNFALKITKIISPEERWGCIK